MNIIAVDDERLSLQVLVTAIKGVLPDIDVQAFRKGSQSLAFLEDNNCDIAFLDICIGDMDGIALAKELKQKFPKVNVIFVTGHMEYAEEAFSVRASGYLRKPVTKEKILKELENLRNPLEVFPVPRIRVQTFGNFEVFLDGKRLHFANAKAKELFALLVDRRGAGLTTVEIAAVLWEEQPYSIILKNRVQKSIMQMRNVLREVGCDDIIYKKHNSTALNTEKILCDCYEFLKGNQQFANTFTGEYMVQYSWAECTTASLYELTLDDGKSRTT